MPLTLDDLRRFAVTRSLFQPTTLERALDTLGFCAGWTRSGRRHGHRTSRCVIASEDIERAIWSGAMKRSASKRISSSTTASVTRAVYELMNPRGGPASKSITRRKRVEALP